MLIASTELSDLLRKVFEGAGLPFGDEDDCARAVAWLALHDWPIWDAIEPLVQHTSARPAAILSEDERSVVLDGRFQGGLTYGGLAAELAYLKAQPGIMGRVTVYNALFPQLLLPYMETVARRGVSLQACWKTTDAAYCATIAAHDRYPTVILFAPDAAEPGLTIFCGRKALSIPRTGSIKRRIEPRHFEAARLRHLANGLMIDDALWQRLIALSKAVLVEETALSRAKGAGENA